MHAYIYMFELLHPHIFYGGCNNDILCILSGLKFVEVRTVLPRVIDLTKVNCDFSYHP
jgi:hypothetical protein